MYAWRISGNLRTKQVERLNSSFAAMLSAYAERHLHLKLSGFAVS